VVPVGFELPVVYNVAMAVSREQQRSSAARFATTHWSIVRAAGQGASSESRKALATLCRTYWYPLYAYLRRQGHGAEDAQDLTQSFFVGFLEKNYFQVVTPEKGKFRSYLLGALKHFVSNERDRARAVKRGGGRAVISLDFQTAESRYGFEPSHELTAEKTFERCWALTVLDQVLGRLQEEFTGADKEELFERLKVFLTAKKGAVSYKEVARELDMSEGAVKVAVHRLRRRYRKLLKEEIAQTVSDPEEAEDEIRYLLAAISS